MTQINTYDSSSIKKLTEKEKIVNNLWMYMWRTDEYGVVQQFREVFDNSVDEALSWYCTQIETIVNIPENTITVIDNGRGIPVGYSETGVSTIEEIFTTIHMGWKFDNWDATKSYEFSGGMHGVWSCLITYVSDFVDITVKRDGHIYNLRFEDGSLVTKTHIVGETTETWTIITWRPSKKYLDYNKIPYDKINNVLKRQQFLTQGLTFIIKSIDSQGNILTTDTYINESGLSEYINYILRSDPSLKPVSKVYEIEEQVLYFENKHKEQEKFKVAYSFEYINQNKVQILWYTNNIHQPEWWTHVQWLLDLIYNSLKSSLESTGVKLPKDTTKEDYLNGLVWVISVSIKRPILEWQTKNKLWDTFVPVVMWQQLSEQLRVMLLSDTKQLDIIAKHIQTNVETRRSIENIEKATLKKVKDPILDSDSKLIDAEWKDRDKCELFIVEGDSAGGGINEMRDSQTQWVYLLKGKPLNAITTDTQKIFDNKELKNLIYALWTGIGKSFDLTKKRYSKIFILSDSDVDGNHISTLLIGFIKKLMPQLLVNNMIYKVVPPLYGITTKKWEKVYLRDKKSLLEYQEKHNWENYTITRFKGLGEMNPSELYETCINPKNRITDLIIDTETEENNDFIQWILGSDWQFKYDFLKNYESIETLEVKKKSKKEISQITAEWMYDYGMYVNQDRAISSLEDGLKPVHKRILWAMNKMWLSSWWATTKSARVVGETIGKYHPHGDNAVYQAAVKLTQEFYMNNPLIEKQGNFWSIFDFNSYADQRYTEIKLSKFTEDILLSDLTEKNQIVDFRPNYDGTIVEPTYLPSKLPLSLLLPSFWIWLWMSNDIPPHNVSEVIDGLVNTLQNPEYDITNSIKWPDFPIIDNEIISDIQEIQNVYTNGWSIRYRAKLDYDQKKNSLVLRTLPYNVEFNTIYKKLLELSRWTRKVLKKWKEVTEDIPYNKSLKHEIKKIINLSGTGGKKNENPINLIIELNKDTNVEIVKAKLYKLTDLETTVPFRPILINRNKKIKKYNLKTIINDFIIFRKETLVKLFTYKIGELENILSNLNLKLLVNTNLQQVIDIIYNWDNEEIIKQQLIDLLNINDEQVDYILWLTLKSLKKTDKDLDNKIVQTKQDIESYQQLLVDKNLVKYMIKEFKDLDKKYWTTRKTEIIGKQETINLSSNIEAIYEDKQVNLFINFNKGIIYKVSWRDVKVTNRYQEFISKYQDGQDQIKTIICNNRDKIYIVQEWKGYIISVGNIKEETSMPLSLYNNKIQTSKNIQMVFTDSDSQKTILVIFDDNNIARSLVKDLIKKTQEFKVSSKNILDYYIVDISENDNIIRISNDWYIIRHQQQVIPERKGLGTWVKVKSDTKDLWVLKNEDNIIIDGKYIPVSELKQQVREVRGTKISNLEFKDISDLRTTQVQLQESIDE